MEFFALFFEISRESIFGNNASDKDDDDRERIINIFRLDDFFDRFDENINTGGNNDECNNDSSSAFDFLAALGEFFGACDFFANDDEKTGNRINQAVRGIRNDGDRVRN